MFTKLYTPEKLFPTLNTMTETINETQLTQNAVYHITQIPFRHISPYNQDRAIT
jgi:hypothetical protein